MPCLGPSADEMAAYERHEIAKMNKLIPLALNQAANVLGDTKAQGLFDMHELGEIYRGPLGQTMNWTLDQLTQILCSFCKQLAPMVEGELVLRRHAELWAWWEEHQRLDQQRERR